MALQMTWHPRCRRAGPPLGLKNLGNSCYLNSVLQCLTFTPPLAQFCLSNHHSAICKKLFVNRDKECAFCILERQIVRSLSLDGPVDAPSKIQKCLALLSEHFRWGRQEDAHEFLRYVIDACHNACLRVIKRGQGNGNGGKAAGIVNGSSKGGEGAGGAAGQSTVMSQIFGGALLSQVKCLGCKAESNKTDEIMDVCLDVIQSNSLKDALTRFFQPEVLDGNNKYNCGSCKRLCVARKQMFIQQAPSVLVIQLKRFEGIHGGKINKNISFDEVLELSDFMHHTSQDPVPEYSLFGSIVHSGFSPESGHYYSYVKDASNSWYCCNDAHVALSTAKEVLSDKVYILFYLLSNPNPKLKKLGSSCNGWKSLDSNASEALGTKPVGMLKQTDIQANNVSSKSNGTTLLNNGMHAPQIKPIALKRLQAKKVILNSNGNIEAPNNSSAEKRIVSTESTNKTNTENKVQRASATNGKISSGSTEPSPIRTCFTSEGNECANSLDNKTHVHNGINSPGAGKMVVDCHSFRSPTSKHPNDDSAVASKSCKNKITENSIVHVEEPSNLLGERTSYSDKKSNSKRHFEEDLEKFKEVLSGEVLSLLHSCGWVNEVENFMHSRKKLCQQTVTSGSDNGLIKKQLILDAKEIWISKVPQSIKQHLIQIVSSYFQEKLVLKA